MKFYTRKESKMRKEQILLAVLLVSTALFIQGCVVVAAGAGAGTIAYVRGDLEVVESKDLDTVYNATEEAMDELELNVTQKTKDAMSAEIVARDAQDKKITVKLVATAEETTKVSIRVGIFGDEAKSRLIYQKIHDNLQQ
jgi:hypothetical protein